MKEELSCFNPVLTEYAMKIQSKAEKEFYEENKEVIEKTYKKFEKFINSLEEKIN